MMDMVNEQYPEINWVLDSKQKIRKENYDACDSLVCALAYINTKRYGNLDGKVKNYTIEKDGNGNNIINYTSEVWGKEYNKRIVIPNVE